LLQNSVVIDDHWVTEVSGQSQFGG